MSLYDKIVAGEEKIALVGLGYVGMPIAVAFARKVKVVGFDLNAAKIDLYKNGIDPTNEVGNDVIKNTAVEFTADPAKLKEAKFHIVAVPTPVNEDHTPDLTPVEGASRLLGQNLTKGSIVVFVSGQFSLNVNPRTATFAFLTGRSAAMSFLTTLSATYLPISSFIRLPERMICE